MKPLIRSASVAAAALVASLGLAAAAAPAAFAATAYCTGRNDLAIMAHADDDFYFAADQIKPNIADGHCFRVVHLTGGDAEYKSDDYYWTRVRAALAGYEGMLGLQSPQWTDTWDVVNGKEVLRYQTALTRNATGPLQTLEVQVVGLPCGWYNQGGSKMGKSLGELVNDAELRAITIDGKGTSYNLAEVRAFLEKIFTDEQPSTIFTLDPYGHFFYNGHEGQHPDHIVTARLAQESAYVASHPTVVKYFKTYNLNDLPANLDSAGIIAKNEAMLGYVSVDPGPFTLGEGAKDCSGLSISDQLGDKGWLCKDYAAQDGTYFQAAQLKLADGRCLAVRKSDGEVTFATCTDTAYATDFSLDGQGQVFVGNATRRRLGTTLSAGSEVTAPLYDDTPSDITVTQWRYNPTSKTLQQTDQKTDPSNAQLICVAPNGTGVAMVDCGSGAALTVTRGAAAPTGVPLTIKNKVHGRCVLLSASGEAGAVSMGDCASSDARLKLNAAGQLASAANPNQCLQRREFQQKSLYDGAPCNSASFGQRFALTRVASGTDYTFVSRTPATCMEDLDGLSGEGCHNYEHQLWQLALVDSDGDGDVDQTITFDPLADRTYGEAPFLLTASASSGLPVGFHVVSGPALIAGDVVTITGAGLVTVEATQPGDTQYAAAAPVQQSFMVHPVGLAVTADNATKVYGQPNPAFSASYSGFVAGDGPASLGGTLNFTTAATADSPVGSYPVTPGGLTSDNYTIAFVSGSLLVTRAPLAVKANDASRPLGQPNPAFTVTVSGFVAGDTLASLAGSLSFVTPADLFSPPGTYSITPSGISSPNYAIAFLDGVLTVGAGPDGRIHGDGHILTGGAHHHFKLRVSEGRKKDEGRLEYWVKPERHANAPGEHGAEDGSSDAEFGRSHAGASAGFEATAITFVAFSDDPATRPGKAPRPDVDAVLFAGMGRWNGRDDGYSFEARAIDRGEPGRGRDEFALTVRDSAGALVASVSGLLDGGNIEAMKVGK